MTRARDLANLVGSGNYSSTTFTATAGQTAFTISHTQGFVQVFMNGLLLDETVDYTSNGTAITLTSGASVGDEIEVVAYNTFSVGDGIAASGGTFTGAVTANSGLTVNRSTSDGTVIDVKKDGTSAGSIGSESGSGFDAMYVANGDTGVIFQGYSNDAIIPFDANALDKRDAAIDLGYPSGRFRNLYLSGGAHIGGTSTANELDDYEEGVWTPTIHQGGFGITVSMAKYTKIGRQVTILTDSALTGSGNSSDLIIGGLPFTNSYLGYASGAGYTQFWPGANHFTPTVGASGTLVRFMTGAGAYYDANAFSAGYINFTITYFV